ncbi:MAG: acyltransferase family protein [Lachnospiraceae bacterium]|nr:acyltransferase family protein [Lachnospiraceae bacterium]
MKTTEKSMNEISSNDKAQIRESGPDLIRSLACFFVVGAHFYLNMGYYNEPMAGWKMFVETSCRWLFVTAVPLFFMLTGYFKKNKKMDRAHYMSIVPLLISYVVISVAKMILYNRLYGKIYGIKEMFVNLGNYQIAWYMGLYLCVFLLIPFLNKGWYALTQKEQNVLIGTLVFLCALYPVWNYIAPSYFTGIYPVLFYFLGIAVRDRRWRPNRLILIGVIAVTVLTEALISMKLTSTGLFDWNLISTPDGTYGTAFITICTVCIFLLFYDVNITSKTVRFLLSKISGVSFEIYLFAGAYDAIIYGYAKRYLTGPVQSFWWFFVTVPLSFTCALVSSLIFRFIVDKILLIFNPSASG